MRPLCHLRLATARLGDQLSFVASHWWLVRATYVVDGLFLGDFFWKVVGTVRIQVSHVQGHSRVEGELLTCGGDIHVWDLLTCGGDIHVWELLTCGGDIHVWDLLTCGGDIHVWDLLTCGGGIHVWSYSRVEGTFTCGTYVTLEAFSVIQHNFLF